MICSVRRRARIAIPPTHETVKWVLRLALLKASQYSPLLVCATQVMLHSIIARRKLKALWKAILALLDLILVVESKKHDRFIDNNNILC